MTGTRTWPATASGRGGRRAFRSNGRRRILHYARRGARADRTGRIPASGMLLARRRARRVRRLQGRGVGGRQPHARGAAHARSHIVEPCWGTSSATTGRGLHAAVRSRSSTASPCSSELDTRRWRSRGPKPISRRRCALAVSSGVSEVGCWALAPDERLGRRLVGLGFQDGWQPHWMGIEPSRRAPLSGRIVEEEPRVLRGAPLRPRSGSLGRGTALRHGRRPGARRARRPLHVEGDTGGVYDSGRRASRATRERDGADVGRNSGRRTSSAARA